MHRHALLPTSIATALVAAALTLLPAVALAQASSAATTPEDVVAAYVAGVAAADADEAIDGSIIAPADPERVAAFVAAVDPSRLAGLRVVEVRLPDPEHAMSERYLTMVAKTAAVYGADEMVERLALVELDAGTYGLGFTLLRYGDSWGVPSRSSAMGGTDALGTAMPMTQDEFDDITGD